MWLQDKSIFIYLIVTVLTVFLAWYVNLPAIRSHSASRLKGDSPQPDLNNGMDMSCGANKFCSKHPMTRQHYFNLVLVMSIFILLFAVSACRIAVGNDYWVYRSDFLLIQQNRHVAFEFGFVWVVRALQAMLNYDQYLPIFAFFSFFTVLFFVRGIYDQSEQFCYSIYLFMTAGYYFSSLNSVRYYLVLNMCCPVNGASLFCGSVWEPASINQCWW